MKLFPILLLFSVTAISAQTLAPAYPIIDGEIGYDSVVTVEGVNAQKLHDRCISWVSETFKSAKSATDLDTPDEVVARGNFTFPIGGGLTANTMRCSFKLSVKFKDGRFRYTLRDFVLDMQGSNVGADQMISDKMVFKKNGESRKLYMQYRVGVLDNSNALIKSLIETMSKDGKSGW